MYIFYSTFSNIIVSFFLFAGTMDPQQQFCLKWNSYSSNLAMTFSNLFKSELLADVTLFCGGKQQRHGRAAAAAAALNFNPFSFHVYANKYNNKIAFALLHRRRRRTHSIKNCASRHKIVFPFIRAYSNRPYI